jgi:hypothetical protein
MVSERPGAEEPSLLRPPSPEPKGDTERLPGQALRTRRAGRPIRRGA